MKNFVKIFGIIIAALALALSACSTESKVLPKKPVITSQPLSNQYGQDAEADSLTVTATTKDKKAKLTYQWYSSASTSTKGGTKIAGASGALTSGVEGGHYTPDTDTIGTAYYYVEVTSTLNKEKAKTTSDVAVITVIDQSDIPQISANNGDPSATGAGDELVLTVTVNNEDEDDDPVVSYQWYRNTRNSNSGGTPIEGETGASYMPPTEVEGTTYYYVVITTESGKVMTSNPMRVTIIINDIDLSKANAQIPFIERQPRAVTAYVDLEPAEVSVAASVTDRGTLTYQWYSHENNSNIDGTPVEGATAAAYRPPMTPGMTYYYVEVTNTIPDNGDGGLKVRSVVSVPVRVTIIKGLDAIAPTISVQPLSPSVTYAVGAAITPLTVTATIPTEQTEAGGKITYQWYRYKFAADGTTIQDEEAVPLPQGSTDTTYGKNASFTPPNNEKSLWYFYVIVTNTLPTPNPPDGAVKVATTKSNAACVGVGITISTLSGISVSNKVYDGTTTATMNGVPQISKNPPANDDDIWLVGGGGTVEFPQANVGSNLRIILTGWVLGGSKKDDYLLQLPTLTASITQAPGSTVTKPNAATAVVTNNSITVEEVTVNDTTTGQTVQYSIDGSNWQAGTTFTGLNAAANYTVRARAAANTNYAAGTVSTSDTITTLDPVVTFETNGGSAKDGATVVKGGTLTPGQAYPDPTRSGYVFDYWYTTSALTIPYDFDTVVNNNMTIYAKWVSQADIVTMAGKAIPMVWVRGGSYTMGAPVSESSTSTNERPVHKVNLSGFWMAKTETTQDVYTTVMGGYPYGNSYGSFASPSSWSSLPSGETGKLPVNNVSFYEAVKFCNLLSVQEGLAPAYSITYSWTQGAIYDSKGNQFVTFPSYTGTDATKWPMVCNFLFTGTSTDSYYDGPKKYSTYAQIVRNAYDNITIVAGANGYRLPTEAQWEYAARGGTDTAYVGGNTISNNTGWYTNNSEVDSTKRFHAVGLRPVNPVNSYGLYDMHGNVAEWCWDWYSATAYTSGTQTNPAGTAKGSNTGRVLRGGYYDSPAADIRSAYRVGKGENVTGITSYNPNSDGAALYNFSLISTYDGGYHISPSCSSVNTTYAIARGYQGFRVVKP